MITISILLRNLQNNIINSYINYQNLTDIHGIQIIDCQKNYSSHVLYIGEVSRVLDALHTAEFENNVTILCAGDTEELAYTDIPSDCNVITFSMETIELYNFVSRYLQQYFEWLSKLSDCIESNQSLDVLLNIGFTQIKVPLVLINNAYKCLAICVPKDYDDYILNELNENGFLSYDSIQSLHKNIDFEQVYSPTHREVILSRNKHYVISRVICHDRSPMARLSLHLYDNIPNECLSDLSNVLSIYVQKHMENSGLEQYHMRDDFNAFITELIEQRITNPKELEQRIMLLPEFAIQKYYHFVIIHFEQANDTIPWMFFTAQLSSLFPQSNIAVYHNEIILLVRKMHGNVILKFDEKRLTALLKLYDGYALIGNYSKMLTSMHVLYKQVRSIYPIGIAFRESDEERIFVYEKYSIYHTISLCADTFLKNNPGDKLIYLCHPALIALLRYDSFYHTNLKDILYHYLVNERNSTKTAEELFVHRNTMLNKINKIEEIMCQSLDDANFRERLMFSFHVLEYMDKILHINPLSLDKYTPLIP